MLSGLAIDSYNINISLYGDLVFEQSVHITELTYNVSEFGNYTISIAAVTSSNLNRYWTNIQIKIPTGINKSNYITWWLFLLTWFVTVKFNDYSILLMKNDQEWTGKYAIMVGIALSCITYTKEARLV